MNTERESQGGAEPVVVACIAGGRDPGRRQRFVLHLMDALRPLADPEAIQAEVDRRLAEHLGADRAFYGEASADGLITIATDHHAGGAASVAGQYALDAFGRAFADALRAGRTLVIADVTTAESISPDARQACRDHRIAALVEVPLMHHGRLAALLAVHQMEPRNWRADEVALIEEIAERTWAVVERAKAEAALRASEARCRALFEATGAGFCIVEPVFEGGACVDVRIREESPAVRRIDGAPAAERLLSEMHAGEPAWHAVVGRVAWSGEPERCECRAAPEGPWFDLYAFKPEWAGAGRVAIVYHDVTERRRAELAASRLAATVESSDDAIIRKDLDGIIEAWNAGAERMFGYRAEEVIGKSVTILMPPDRVEEEPGILARIRRGDRVDHYETVRQRKDGSLLDVSLCVSPILDHDGRPVAASKIAREITQRKRGEAALRASEQRQGFLLLLSDAMREQADERSVGEVCVRMLARHLQLDRCYVARLSREQGRARLGAEYRREDLPSAFGGSREWALSDCPGVVARLDEGTLVVNDVTCDPRFSAADRTAIGLIGIPAFIAAPLREGERNVTWALTAGSVAPRTWTAEDVRLVEDVAERAWGTVERARMEVELRESRARLAAELSAMQRLHEVSTLATTGAERNELLAAALDATIALHGADFGDIQLYDATHALLRIVTQRGFDPDWVDRYAAVDVGAMDTTCSVAIARRERVIVEDFEPAAASAPGSGAARAAGFRAVQSTPLFTTAGEPLGVISTHFRRPRTFTDIELRLTDLFARELARAIERTVIEDALRENEARLRGANRAKDEFLAMLGHELRNPLAPIATTLQLMKLRAPDTFARERGVIEGQVRYLGGLVDDLLDVARIASGKFELKLERVDLREVVDAAIETMQPALEERRQVLHAHADGGLVVSGDRRRLVQVLVNLLGNAAKYSPPDRNIYLSAAAEDGQAVLRVRDEGQGIGPELLPHVFESFTQDSQSIERASGGLGLGLSIVRNIVVLHGGSVEAASEGSYKGSEFIVRLPLLEPGAAVPGATAEPSRPAHADWRGRRTQVLIVDDYALAAESLAMLLQEMGYHTRVARDGAEALQAIGEFKPQIALVDIGLPVIDGYEVAQAVRAMPGFERLPLVAVTGYGQANDRTRALAAGFDEHVVKPLDAAKVGELIERMVAARR